MFDSLLFPMLIPLIAGCLGLLLPRGWSRLHGWLAVVATVLTLVVAGQVFYEGERTLDGWLLLRVDHLSGFILLSVAVFAVLITIYSLDYMRERPTQRSYYTCLLWSLALSGGVLLANDLILLLVCWGGLAVTLYLMIGLSGRQASAAARKTLLMVGGTDALLLLGSVLWWAQQGSWRMDAGAMSMDMPTSWLALLCFVSAAFAKAGAMPLHSWVPDCGEQADAPVTAYLPASLDKLLGIYLLSRTVMQPHGLFESSEITNLLLMILGALTMMVAVMMALVQHNLKRLLAFHAVSQVGYMIVGIATGTPLGLAGSLFHMLNNAIYKSCLFLVAGVVERKAGTVDLDRLGGLATRLPVTFLVCLVAALSISGIPPLNGFASKWMIYQAVFAAGQESGSLLWVIWLAAAILGSALTLASFVKILHSVFLCKPAPQVRQQTIHRPGWSTILPLLFLATTCVVFGVFAHAIPLRFLVLPAIEAPVTFPGTWWATQVSGLLLVGFLGGWGVYALALRNGKLRHSPTYIGGERMAETRIPGVASGAERHVEVTGVDFYRTVEQLPVLQQAYALAHRKCSDLYEITGSLMVRLAGLLSAAHVGQLPWYLAWCVLGLLGILYLMMRGSA